jgi:hypothetical protein
MNEMELTKEEEFYHHRALWHTGLGWEVRRFELWKILSLAAVIALLLWFDNPIWGVALLILHGVISLAETERALKGARAYQSIIRKLSRADTPSRIHGR